MKTALDFFPHKSPSNSFSGIVLPRPIKLAWAVLICFIAMAARSGAEPILFTFSGTGGGSAGGTSFANAPFSIQFFGDTTGVTPTGTGSFSIQDSVSTLYVEGIGAGSFAVDMRMFALQSGTVGFGVEGGNTLLVLTGPALAGYDLKSSFVPATFAGVGADPLERFRNIGTTLGPVSLTSAQDVTFSATMVPEPSTVGLLVAAAVSLVICRQAKRKP